MGKRSIEIEILQICQDAKKQKIDELAHEEEVIVKLQGEVRRFYCIPTDLEEMIMGYLRSSGIELPWSSIKRLGDNEFEVNTCGLRAKPLIRCDSNKRLTKTDVFNLVETLDKNSILYQRTGCAHVIGIREDAKEVFVEDISRHCAIDKAIGIAIKRGINFTNSVLIGSCRQTASTITKAIFCQIPIVISIAAPTDLATTEAARYGITLIGFASLQRFNIYSHESRIEV